MATWRRWSSGVVSGRLAPRVVTSLAMSPDSGSVDGVASAPGTVTGAVVVVTGVAVGF